MKRRYFYGPILVVAVVVVLFREQLPIFAAPILSKIRRTHSVSSRLNQFGDAARERWKPYFTRAQISYPPNRVILVGLKDDKLLEVYASNSAGETEFIRTLEICASSGTIGPKLSEGDLQVPEGIYKLSFLNPNSSYHVSLRLNYPNSYDQAKAKLDGRSNLGGDIMIHGKCVSIGCLAMRDEPVEDLFTLAADSGIGNIKVILTPFDLRAKQFTQDLYAQMPSWTSELYDQIKLELEKLPERKET